MAKSPPSGVRAFTQTTLLPKRTDLATSSSGDVVKNSASVGGSASDEFGVFHGNGPRRSLAARGGTSTPSGGKDARPEGVSKNFNQLP